MVVGMATTQKITVTLPREQVDAIRRLVASGQSTSISGFVQHAVAIALDDVAGWAEMLAEALSATGGELSDAEREWADGILEGAGKTPVEAA